MQKEQSTDPRTEPAAESASRGRTSSRSIAALRFDLRWRSDAVRHCDSLFLPAVDLWNDELPKPVRDDIMNKPIGHQATWRLAAGQLLSQSLPERVVALPANLFNRRFLGRGAMKPRRGRFYPKGILVGFHDIHAADRSPCRVVGVETDALVVDLNHPLAGRELELSLTIEDILNTRGGRAGPRLDVRARLTDNGPGMQARWRGQPTDFLADDALARMDEDDPGFYARPRLVDHLDSTAIAEISALYGRLIPRRSRILDLMASWHSHLPDAVHADGVTGLGMNPEELAQNPVLTGRVVHDLNAEPRLPFEDESFDAVVCSVSVEYLTDPFAVFRDLARVLTPRGIAIMTFSNRWFPTKAVRIWEQLHEFERPGLVLEYFRESGRFRDFDTWSLRGLPRPADDKYAHRLDQSDPVYAVWARRDGEPRVRL
jgi:SAM-dependent methyltransferase